MRRSFWAIFAICRARRQSALERGKKERGKTRNIIIPLGTMPKRGKEGEVQARTNSLRMQVACATRQEMPFPLLSLFPPHRTIIAAARTLYSAACAYGLVCRIH